jgi:hypothetical protein
MLVAIAAAWLAATPSLAAPQLGLQVDVGVPDGAGAALTLTPWQWLRLDLGAAHNGAVVGIRGGVTLAPFATFIRPTLSLHAERFPEGDLRAFARALGTSDGVATSLLSSVQYDLLTAHAGLELGSPSGVSLFLRAGIGRATARFPEAQAALRDAFADPTLTSRPVILKLLAPSIQVGLCTPIF